MSHPTRAVVHLDRLGHNLALLRELAEGRPLWPCIKANAYGHGLLGIARELEHLGCDTLCVAHASEAAALRDAGVRARLVLLSAALPEASEAVAGAGFEPVVCTREALETLSAEAVRAGREVAVHLKVDTGMGRIGVQPAQAASFVALAQELPALRLRGLMSHFARADEADKGFSQRQLEGFAQVCEATRGAGIELRHMANSAALFDLPESRFDAVRPGIALYGLAPGPAIANPRVAELEPVLDWSTRITFLKEVPAGVGLSYGHSFRTSRPSLIATLPVGYGDGLARGLSNRMSVLVGGRRCPQVGTISMDQTLVDVTALRGEVALGDEAVLLGRQGEARVTAAELAEALGTISYEIVTAISARVPRVERGPGEKP